MTTQYNYKDDNEVEEEEETEQLHLKWSNFLFLPFHPIFKTLVMFVVILKTILGPIQAVYPIVYCWNTMDTPNLVIIKIFYLYFCDPIYGVDTFLHILHRQVTDEAVKREYLPKSAFLLFLDLISLIPFYHLVSEDICPKTGLWPNLLSFSEFVIIYRLVDSYSLLTTHNLGWLLVGFTILLVIILNCVTCFMLLLTFNGLCSSCHEHYYDWRMFVIHKINVSESPVATYIYGTSMILSHIVNKQYDEIKPSTIKEYVVISLLMICGNLLIIFVVFPKMVAEALLKIRSFCTFYPKLLRIVEETKRHNPSSKSYMEVSNFYNLMWKEQNGITSIPEIITQLPKYLRIDIKQDLVWPVFYHSPTFRKTSESYKRWLCEFVHLDYKMPGQKFFAGPYSNSHLFYLKSGIVQLISSEDGTTPLLSVTSGTIFGDISFYLPPSKRKIFTRCLTYCEVLYISRVNILQSLHKYPEDRAMIIHSSQNRVKHARTLYICKQHVRGLDRTEDEGIAWVKRRWWEIYDVVSNWKETSTKKDSSKCELPAEESVYHCAKYIGQLVLCSEVQLHMKSMFANEKFPWIFVPESKFGQIWKIIVNTTVFFVLFLYPPYITRKDIPTWFEFFQFWTDLVYICDICVSLLTSVVVHENISDNFASVMLTRCKCTTFALDVLSTIWIENIALIIGLPNLYAACQFNRLIKIYVLFPKWNIKTDPLYNICIKIILIKFSFIYIFSYFLYMWDKNNPYLTSSYFFGEVFCQRGVSGAKCDFDDGYPLNVVLAFSLEYLFNEYLPYTLTDVCTAMSLSYIVFIFYVYCKTFLVASLYIKYREMCNYQYFVLNIKQHYTHHTIHPKLLQRLNRYLLCHWKYYHGMDVMYPNLLQNEPYDIYWKVHGEVAEKIIRESRAFISADPTLIRELAYKAKILILPKNSTIILFGLLCKNVSWIIQGSVLCEYPNNKGELLNKFYSSGELLTCFGVFFGTQSLRTLTTYTECEILYIKIQDFNRIMQKYPHEWSYLQNCIDEISSSLEVMVRDYVNKHKKYQADCRKQIFQIRKMNFAIPIESTKQTISSQYYAKGLAWLSPETCFTRYWMMFRAIVVVVSISAAAIQGGSGACYRRPLMMIGKVCNFVAFVDIALKMFLSYYDKKGLLITHLPMTIKHYLSRGFICDLIGLLPITQIVNFIMTEKINDNEGLLLETLSKYAHLYLLLGYFNYETDIPTVNFAYLMILKWQVITFLVMLGAGHFFVHYCIDFKWDQNANLVGMSRQNHCWLPNYFPLDSIPTVYQLHMVYAESLNLAQSGFMRLNLGKFQINREHLGVGVMLFLLGLVFWFVICYSLTLLVLNYRGNTIFQHGLNQLGRFLKAERVEDSLIHRVKAHFQYWWVRTKGINIQYLMHERIGVIFRQDLGFYFFKKSIEATNTLLKGDESLVRDLASAAVQLYFLPKETVVREMNLTPWIFIVHRGKIKIKQGDEELAILTKGSIFGQLDGVMSRPIRITAVSEDYTDLLRIPIKDFQDFISDKVRENIKKNLQSKNDFMAVPKIVFENPYNTVKYLLRGRKAIKFPWMKKPANVHSSSWFYRWLFLVWVINPVATAYMILFFTTVPIEFHFEFYFCFLFFDILYVVFIITEYFSIELSVEHGICVDRVLKWRLFQTWQFYVDLFSLIIPLLTHYLNYHNYEVLRLLRLRLLFDFHQQFCKEFQSTIAPMLLKFIIVTLLLHCMTCGWIYIACRESEFPLPYTSLPEFLNVTVDYTEWTTPDKRKGGCARLTKNFLKDNKIHFRFLVPIYWTADYVVAMLYIIIIYTHAEMDVVVALTLKQIYYKLFINCIIYITEIWILSIAINTIYTKCRELYSYEYNVRNLIQYLQNTGLSPTLLNSVKEYTNQLWKRQRGNWLPELAQHAPQCLREDLLGALYLHHLLTTPLLRDLPLYFNRQLVTRVQRIVIFPGKFIVREGDIFSLLYFIHEGEVERWYTDANGEKKLHSVLNTNRFFGLIPMLCPNTPFRFSYFSRTVVDIVYLKHKDLFDLMLSYPDVKKNLYAAASTYKKTSI